MRKPLSIATILAVSLTVGASFWAVANAAEDKQTAAAANAALRRSGANVSPGASVPNGAMRIGVVDLDRVTRESAFSRVQADSVQAGLAQATREFETKKAELDRLGDEYQRQRALLTDDQRRDRERVLRDLVTEIEDLDARAQRDFKRANADAQRVFLRRLKETTDAIGEEGAYDLILSADLVLYAGPRADITDAVVARLDASTGAAPTAPAQP